MKSNNETLILVLTLLITGAFLGAGYWWFKQQGNQQGQIPSNPVTKTNTNTKTNNSQPNSQPTAQFTYPQNVPSGTNIRIDGSTSLAHINQALKQTFEQKFPNTLVTINAKGSSNGIQALLAGKIDIAAISRPLTPAEKQQGLQAIPITRDAIAIVVGVGNAYRRGLNQRQVIDIFTGKIDNWQGVGGDNLPIKVINRPQESGTRQIFQALVLEGQNFGNFVNFHTLDRDATTPMLRMLNKDGIGYATYNQVASQQTVRVIAIDGLTPEAPNYPYQRPLFYVYQSPPSPQVQAFLGYATSGIGKQIIEDVKLQAEISANISQSNASSVNSQPKSTAKPVKPPSTVASSPSQSKPTVNQASVTNPINSNQPASKIIPQKQKPPLNSPSSSPPANPFLSKKIRGIYLSRYQITNRTDEKTIRQRVRYYKSKGFNTIIHGVWGNGCTMYDSQVLQDRFGFRHCPNLFQAQWLNWLIDEAHRQGIEVHGYFEKGIKIDRNSPIYQLARQKQWLVAGVDKTYQGIDHYVLDVNNPEVVQLFTEIAGEFARKYPQIDAIQWDDYLGYHAELKTDRDYTALLTKFVQGMVTAVKNNNPNISFDICHHNPYWAGRYFAADWEKWNVDRVFIQAYNEKNFDAEVDYAKQYAGIAITDNQLHRLPEIVKNKQIKSILVFPLAGNPQQTASRVNQLL